MHRLAIRLSRLKVTVFAMWLMVLPGLNQIWQYRPTIDGPGVTLPEESRPLEVVLPVDTKRLPLPPISAKSFLVMDERTGALLAEKEITREMYPASITKLMTAVVAREHFPLEQELTVGRESEAIGSSVGLRYGERMKVADLLRGLMVASGNDAAFVLANAYPGGYGAFVERMNQKARELGMEKSTFRNVSGVEQEGHLTTARDLTVLARAAMLDPFVRETVRMPSVTLGSGTLLRTYPSTNKLLGVVSGMEGIKTGWTTQAGECLLTQTTRDGNTVYVVILDSEDRFGDTKALVEWVFSGHQWMRFSRPTETL